MGELDYRVARAMGDEPGGRYTVEWSLAGPIIERERIELYHDGIRWKAAVRTRRRKVLPNGFQVETGWHKVSEGQTALIAAMKCFVETRNDRA